MTASFTTEELSALQRIEHAPDAEESLRDRVGRALWENLKLEEKWADLEEWHREAYRQDADIAIAVINTPVAPAAEQ